MAENIADPGTQGGSALAGMPRVYKVWVAGLLGIGILLVGLGIWLAGSTAGTVRPWTGAGLAVVLGLAAIVGASKTSSA